MKGKFDEEKYNKRYYDNMFYDFIELKNKDLILWSRGKIFYYKKSEDKYVKSQVINELKQQKNEIKICQLGYIEIYNLYNIIELENNIILSCNSIGIKIYNFIENEYKLIKVIPMFLDVENMFHIKNNNFLVIHHCTYYSGGCRPATYHKYALSLFDLKSSSINKTFFNDQTEIDYLGDSNYRFIYFFLENNFIYQLCNFPNFDFHERIINKKDALTLYCHLYNIKTEKNVLNLKTSFFLISYFKDNLVFAIDYESLNICYFENNTFTSVYKFNFNNPNIYILKNNDLIVFGEKKIWQELKYDDDKTYRIFAKIDYYYNQYEYLEK